MGGASGIHGFPHLARRGCARCGAPGCAEEPADFTRISDEFELLSLRRFSQRTTCAPKPKAQGGPGKEGYGDPQEMRECGLYLPCPPKGQILQCPLRGHRE
jgi:hypothetical protein